MFSEPHFCSPSPLGRRLCKPDFMELAKQNKQAQDPGEKPGCLLVSLEGQPAPHLFTGQIPLS